MPNANGAAELVLVCPAHEDYQVPLIFTFAFPGAEHWCPYCGYTSGIFGAGERVVASPDLTRRSEVYELASAKWQSANGVKFGGGRREIDGVLCGYNDLPEADRQALDAVLDQGWAYEVRAEDLDVPPVDEPRPQMTCDGCGKVVDAVKHPNGEWAKPPHWYERSDKDGTQRACSRECIDIVARRTGKTTLVMPW